MNERDIILYERPCDPRRVQAILADWGLDKATIRRMLSEQQARESQRRQRASATSQGETDEPYTESIKRGH